MFEKSNKENVYENLGINHLALGNKHRTNIGEQIRKKLKIKPLASDPTSVLMARDQNVPRDNRLKIENKYHINRLPLMQRSVQMGKQTSRSNKSVRFNEELEKPTLNRKHSTSSILKNSKPVRKQRFSQKMSINNSVCSNILKDDQSTENKSFNKITKQKFQNMHQMLKKTDKMYSDELFPPVFSSISRNKDGMFKQLKWMRLSEIFAGKYLTVWQPNDSIKITKGEFAKSSVLSTCFNSIKHNNFMVQKMFESQKFNQNGIYYVKISQNNTWKYIIIDDYIPVIKQDKKNIPAFLNVSCSNPHQMQIWPFLLQKAYAKYYSNFQSLQLCQEIDFLQQITGCYPEQLSAIVDMDQICHQINSYDSILIAKDYRNNYHPIIPKRSILTCQNPEAQYLAFSFTPEEFKQRFVRVYCVLLHKYFYSGFCTIKYNSSKPENQNQISLRTIKVEQSSQCVFSLAQKDFKHYYLSDYNYTWVRMIVIMKESDKNYRWVTGAYKNTKYLNLSLWLQPAQYIVVIIPEWKTKGYDLNLTFQGNIKANIDRKTYAGNQQILIEAAMDLAQSKGRLKQLNPNICTYSYIQYNVGLIIENINNQRPNGFVRILRSIEGLQKAGENLIKPFNIEFKFNPTIQVKIESLQHFTVVLAVQGGVNKSFLQQFDFGS